MTTDDLLAPSATDALALLNAGVPLSLLLDLAMPVRSKDIYDSEPGDANWLQASQVA